MYQVTVKGRTLEELKHAVNDINVELHSGVRPVNNVAKVLEEVTRPTIDLAEDEEEVASPYTAHSSEVASPVEVPVAATPEYADTDLDAEGIPWDKRIHASSKSRVAKGTWRTKRNLDLALLAQVKAELLQAINLKANPIAIPAAPITAATPAVAAPVVAPPVVAPPVAAPVVAPPVAAPIAIPAGGHTLESFKANMPMVIGTLITEGKLGQDYVNTLMAHFGVTEIWNVTDEQKAEMFETFAAHSIIVKVG